MQGPEACARSLCGERISYVSTVEEDLWKEIHRSGKMGRTVINIKRKGIPDWGGGDGLSKGVEVGIRRKIRRTVQLENRVQERVEIRTDVGMGASVVRLWAANLYMNHAPYVMHFVKPFVCVKCQPKSG